MSKVSKKEVFDVCGGHWDQFFENVVSDIENGWGDQDEDTNKENYEIVFDYIWEWLDTTFDIDKLAPSIRNFGETIDKVNDLVKEASVKDLYDRHVDYEFEVGR